MRTPVVFSLLLAVALFFSCNRQSVTLSYTNAKEEVPQLGNLVFRFNKAVVKDSLLNAWDSTEYVSFEPKIPGRYRWESPDQLVFSPSAPLNPATDYTAKISKEVLRYSEYDKVEDGDALKFHTAPLGLGNATVTWKGESSTTAVPQLNLEFNYPVDPVSLKDKLKIEVAGRQVSYSVETVSENRVITVLVNGIKTEDKDLETKVIIDKGIKPVKGNKSTTEPIVANTTIPSPFELVIHQVESSYDGTEGIIEVLASQQISAENLRSFIKTDPAVNFNVETSDYGFIIRSNGFDTEKSYSLTLSKGLRGKIGGVLKDDYTRNVAFGELEANIRFTNSKAVYLSKKGAGNIEVQLTNVKKVKLVVSKIYESNLLLAQQYGYYPQEKDRNEDEYYYENDNNFVAGDVIFEKEIDVQSLPKNGIGRLLNVSQFEDRLADFKGIYHIKIRSSEDYWVQDSRFLSLSDIGLIAKEGEDKILVFANSIKSATPIDAVNVSVYGANNQLLGTGATNNTGVAEIAYSKKEFAGFRPAMIVAKTTDDFNYLPFKDTRVNTSRFDIGGKRTNAAGLDVFLYAERDIYRPGEKINYALIIRDRQWKNPGDVPLKLKWLLPNGKELKTIRKSLNEEGGAEGSIDVEGSAITGSYTLEVYTSNDILLASKNFSVEEFMPDRIRVNVKTDKTTLQPGETTNLQVQALNFFGPPAANRRYETEIQVKQKYFSPEKYPDYDFTLANQQSFFDKAVKEGNTDGNGNASVSYEAPPLYANKGVLQTNFYTTVFDETGRPVSRNTAIDIYTQPVFFGIKRDDFYYYPLNRPVNIPLVAVDKNGRAVIATAKVEVIKHEYRTVLAKSGSYFRYESQREDKKIEEKQITIGAGTVYSFVPRSLGDYEVRIYAPGADSYVISSFYSYGNWGSDNQSFEVSREGSIDIEVDKKDYLAGEKVKALFKTPFSGRMLVTLETDNVISYQYVEVNNRSASIELPLNAAHVPNVYITATLFKPHERSDIPLTVAHGFQNIKVEDKGLKIPVSIDAAKNVRSSTKQKVKVKTAPGSYVSLAAVDNGVLQVSDFKTPNPYDYYYQKKALGVNAYDLYPLLFDEIRQTLSSTGGDGELSLDQRVNPMPAKRVKILSFWSGMKKAGGSGVAEFEFDVQAGFSGELRLMAVAYKANSFGGAENTMTVADPIVLSTALPRFLSPGDTTLVPVTITNTTEKTATVDATLNVTGGVKVEGGRQQLTIQPKSEAIALYKVIADPKIGLAKITVNANGLGEKFSQETEISIRPASTLQKRSGSGAVGGGTVQLIQLPVKDFIPATVNYKLVVSRSPVIELGDHLKYLVEYPYGCMEQTISSAFPQLYYGDLADALKQKGNQVNNANNNILEAIRKIKMRQLYNGALSQWEGGGKEDWWSTVYAAHFLMEARNAGFEVDNSLLETILSYLNNRLRKKEMIEYYYNRDQQKKIAPKEVAYTLYVLALADRSNVATMNYYKANTSLLALDSRYLLSAAYALAGNKKSFASMLPSVFGGEVSVRQTGGSYYSDLRDEAIALNALLDVDPGNAQVPVMAKHISDKLKTNRWLNTQERAFAFLALGKLSRAVKASDATAEIKVNGKTIGKMDGNTWTADAKALTGAVIEVVTKGKGKLYYMWEVEGISNTGDYIQEDSYLKLRRNFYTRNGQLITGNAFKQNDLIIVGITLEKSYAGVVENIVITDLLPAGFEIENPRTKEIPGMNWIKDADAPDALDVRDDRIHFFVDAGNRKQHYYYAVRAVSSGSFKLGPASADAMYNAEYHSYHGAGVVKIVQ